MKKTKNRKSAWLKAIAVIVTVVIICAGLLHIAYLHRSDPSDVKQYETDNPHIALNESMISAHRSGAGIAPEETMRAFEMCAGDESFDVDYFEFDLHITKDNHLVLLHDDELDRTSDCETVFGKSHCLPEDYTFEQLRTLNMGAKFVMDDGQMPYSSLSGDDVPNDLKILDLDMVLDYLESIDSFRYIIEIKNTGEKGKKATDLLYEDLKKRNMVDRVIFGCFHEEISKYKDEAYPDLVRGTYGKEAAMFYLYSLLNIKDYHPAFTVLQLPFNEPGEDFHLNSGTARIINYAHEHNLAVQYWTVNEEWEAEYLMSIGADAITSDYPDMVYRVREKNE